VKGVPKHPRFELSISFSISSIQIRSFRPAPGRRGSGTFVRVRSFLDIHWHAAATAMGTAPSTLLGIAHHAASAPMPLKSQAPAVSTLSARSVDNISLKSFPVPPLALPVPVPVTAVAVDRSSCSTSTAAEDSERLLPRFVFISSGHFSASSSSSTSSVSSAASSPRDGQLSNSSGSGLPEDDRCRRLCGRLSSSPITGSAANASSAFADLGNVVVDDDDDERAPMRPMRVTRVSRDRALSDHLRNRAQSGQRPLYQLQLRTASESLEVQPSFSRSTCEDVCVSRSHSLDTSIDSASHFSNTTLESTASPRQRASISSFATATASTTGTTPPASGRTTPSFCGIQTASSAFHSPVRSSVVPATILNTLIADNNARQMQAGRRVAIQ
jgi:hypothetical protein